MASTYSTNLALELIGTGEQAGTWGNTTNTNLGTLIEQAISGYVTQAISDVGDTTITIPNGATGVARNMSIECTGALTGARNLIVPANKKLYFIYNNTTGGFAVTVKVSGQTGIAVPSGKKMILVCNGTDVVEAINYAASASVAHINVTSGTISTLTSTSATITTLKATSATLDNVSFTSMVLTNATITSANITTLTGTTLGYGSASITTVTGTTFGTTGTSQIRGASGSIAQFTATSSTITTLTATSSTITTLASTSATITGLSSTSAAIGKFTAGSSSVSNLFASGSVAVSANLGVGTDTPTQKLDVYRASYGVTARFITADGTRNPRLVVYGSADGTTLQNTFSSSAGNLMFAIGGAEGSGTEVARFDASGNLGLGVTPSAWGGAYTGALQLKSGGALVNNQSNDIHLCNNAFFDGTNWIYYATNRATRYEQFDGGHYWLTASSGTVGNTISFTQAMTLSANGRLSIGSASENAILYVNGAGIDECLRLEATGSPYLSIYDSGTREFYLEASAGGINLIGTTNKAMVFGTNNTERMRISSAGQLGVGVNSPAATVDVLADSGAVGLKIRGRSSDNFGLIQFTANNGTTDYSYIGTAAANVLAFYTNGYTERARIDASGNLGLGVTPSAWGSNYKAFESAGNASAVLAGANVNGVIVSSNAYQNNTNWLYKTTGTAAYYAVGAGTGIHAWYTAPSGTAGNTITFTQAMTLNASGGLAVGTTTDPGAGNIGLAAGKNLQYSSTAYITPEDNSIGARMSTPGAVTFWTGATPTERARVTSGGEFLVGTTSTSASSGNGIKLGVGTSPDLYVVGASSTTGTCFDLYSTGAAAYRFYVGYNGTIYATNTTVSAISDQRLKENVRDLDVGLSAVMALKPRKFDWKAGKGKNIKDDRGFIAQEFEQVFPDLIDEWKDPAPEGEAPYKTVRQDLIPVLVKAIQEQQEMIKALEAKIAALESK